MDITFKMSIKCHKMASLDLVLAIIHNMYEFLCSKIEVNKNSLSHRKSLGLVLNIIKMKSYKTKYFQIYQISWNTNTNRGEKSETMVNYQIIFIHKKICLKKQSQKFTQSGKTSSVKLFEATLVKHACLPALPSIKSFIHH